MKKVAATFVAIGLFTPALPQPEPPPDIPKAEKKNAQKSKSAQKTTKVGEHKGGKPKTK